MDQDSPTNPVKKNLSLNLFPDFVVDMAPSVHDVREAGVQSQLKPYELSSNGEFSDAKSRQAVIDGFNLKPEQVAYKHVKGFKNVVEENVVSDRPIQLQDEVIFSAMNIGAHDSSVPRHPEPVSSSASSKPQSSFNKHNLRSTKQTVIIQNGEQQFEEEAKFSDSLYISNRLAESMNAVCIANMDGQKKVQQYLQKQGILMFNEQAIKTKEHGAPFDHQNEKMVQANVEIVNGEKFEVHNDNDYKQWERYDLHDSRAEGATIPIDMAPDYLKVDLQKGLFQNVDFNDISNLKCGMKLGCKQSDLDARWVEKWYELRCKDMGTEKSKVESSDEGSTDKQVVSYIIVKFYSKFWTNVDKNTIEGESCLQVLSDGSKSKSHDALILELKDNIDMQNILNKEGSLSSSQVQKRL